MMIAPRYPSLYQLNTRVWLRRLSRERDKRVTLAEIDDATIDSFARQGFDWIWLLSVWRTGPAGRTISRSKPEWRAEFGAVLPDLDEDDICGSGFAITAYTVSDEIGGDAALAQFRDRLAQRDIKLMLDFVPNHTAPDHPWVKSNPDYYVQGSEEQIGSAPQNYLRVETDRGPRVLAHGRDPNYPGWPDTLQLNYANPQLQKSQIDELITIAGKCDGVRCDMAMLARIMRGRLANVA
jgi:glycosidase